jgi:hypothetical protein
MRRGQLAVRPCEVSNRVNERIAKSQYARRKHGQNYDDQDDDRPARRFLAVHPAILSGGRQGAIELIFSGMFDYANPRRLAGRSRRNPDGV